LRFLPVASALVHPVLDSVLPVVEGSSDVSVDLDRLADVASWLAYEELPVPSTFFPFPCSLSREEAIDFVLVTASINFAYTGFGTRRRWDLVDGGRVYADADGLHFAFHRALREGLPVLDGRWLAELTTDRLRAVLRGGSSELQLLDERVAILRAVGETLAERYDGRFHTFVASVSPRLYDDGNGFLESLVREFPRFDDVADWHGETVRFWKLAQLAVWILEITLAPGGLGFADLDRLTALADYIVPAGLHAMGVLRYSNPLERAIAGGELIEAGSAWEVELRAHTIHACSLLCRSVNELRPPELRVIEPQIDARFWLPFHKTHAPHHLTRTTYY
jgi:putative queuosine salvage protein